MITVLAVLPQRFAQEVVLLCVRQGHFSSTVKELIFNPRPVVPIPGGWGMKKMPCINAVSSENASYYLTQVASLPPPPPETHLWVAFNSFRLPETPFL